jgi:hypothetical protein
MIHPDRAGWDDGWNRTTSTSTTSRTVRGVAVTVHRHAHGAVVYVLRRPPEQPRRPDDTAP